MELTKNQKIILYILLAAIVATAIWKYVAKNKKATTIADNKPAEETVEKAKAVEAPSVFPLRKGKKGKEVAQLQAWLLKKHGVNMPSVVRGTWEDITEEIVKKVLNKNTVSKEYYLKTGMNTIKV